MIKILGFVKGGGLTKRFTRVLEEFKDNINGLTIKDPGSGGNDLSDALSLEVRLSLSTAASATLRMVASSGWPAVFDKVMCSRLPKRCASKRSARRSSHLRAPRSRGGGISPLLMGIESSVYEGIKQFILDQYPGLMLIDAAEGPIVEGAYDLFHEGNWIASYLVRFAIPAGYPNEIPTVHEIGGRIPKKAAFHVNPDGSLCLGVPEELWIKTGGQFSVEVILDRLLRDHLIGTTSALNGGGWAYGEYSHGGKGVCEFYSKLSRSRTQPTFWLSSTCCKPGRSKGIGRVTAEAQGSFAGAILPMY